MSRDAAKENYMLVDMDGYICLFTNIRLNRDTIPKGLYCYDVRDNDGDGSFAEIQPFVMVNHWGTLVSKEPIPLNQYGCYWPEREEVFLPTSETLDSYMNKRIAKLAELYLSDDERKQLGKTIDSIPDDLFRLRHKPFMMRSGEEQERLENFWCIHAEEIPVSVSKFLGMTKDEYQAWKDGLLSLGDGSYHEMSPSHFRLSGTALKVAQQLLHVGGIDQNLSSMAFRAEGSSVSRTAPPLLSQLFKQLPADKECMLSSFFEAETPNLLLFDPGDEMIAIVTEKEVLYKEDFARLMKDAGIKASESLWQDVWEQFSSDFSSAVPATVSLHEQAQASVERVCTVLARASALDSERLKPALGAVIQNAKERSPEQAHRSALHDDLRPVR